MEREEVLQGYRKDPKRAGERREFANSNDLKSVAFVLLHKTHVSLSILTHLSNIDAHISQGFAANL